MGLDAIRGVAILLVGIGPQRAAAQDYKKKPNFGEVTLKTGYEQDPYKKEVIAGGFSCSLR